MPLPTLKRPTCSYHATPASSPTRTDMSLQVGDAGFKPGTAGFTAWCTTIEPPHSPRKFQEMKIQTRHEIQKNCRTKCDLRHSIYSVHKKVGRFLSTKKYLKIRFTAKKHDFSPKFGLVRKIMITLLNSLQKTGPALNHRMVEGPQESISIFTNPSSTLVVRGYSYHTVR